MFPLLRYREEAPTLRVVITITAKLLAHFSAGSHRASDQEDCDGDICSVLTSLVYEYYPSVAVQNA